jgi:tetratricopeptide (TPR) repeat protein
MLSLKFFGFYSILPVLFFFNLIIGNGQTTNKIDSLLHLVKRQGEDTTKVKLLVKVSREYSKTDPGKAMDYSIQAYMLASNLNYTSGIIDAIIERSNNYTLTSQLDSALVFSQKAIRMSDSIKNDKRMADSYSMQAGILIRKAGPSAAREFYFKAHNLYKKIGDSTGYMNSLNGLGIVYYRQAEYDSAIYYYIEFLRLCEKLKNEEGSGKGLVNLGTS